jgi:hypothetical protein
MTDNGTPPWPSTLCIQQENYSSSIHVRERGKRRKKPYIHVRESSQKKNKTLT